MLFSAFHYLALSLTFAVAPSGIQAEDPPPPPETNYYEIRIEGDDPVLEQRDAAVDVASLDEVTLQNRQTVTIASEVTTRGTSWDCERDSRTSDWTEVTVPPNYVFNKDTLVKNIYSDNGSSNRCDHQWDDYVEIVPGTGIMMPRTLRIRTHARSPECNYPGHNYGARGWTKARATAEYVRYQ